MTALPLLIILLITIVTTGLPPSPQQPSSQESDEMAINELYAQWSQAIATRGAEGYASFFVDNAALLPPNAPAVEGRDAIRKWIEKTLAEYTTKDARISFGPLKIGNGWATRRFTMTGQRVAKKGGETVQFNNKYLDVIQKQADGRWMFVYRMWSSNEG